MAKSSLQRLLTNGYNVRFMPDKEGFCAVVMLSKNTLIATGKTPEDAANKLINDVIQIKPLKRGRNLGGKNKPKEVSND